MELIINNLVAYRGCREHLFTNGVFIKKVIQCVRGSWQNMPLNDKRLFRARFYLLRDISGVCVFLEPPVRGLPRV